MLQAAVGRSPSSWSRNSPSLHPHRVLLVESDETARSLLELGFRRAGFEVTSSASGRDAHAILSGARLVPDVVIVASSLNGEDGFSFIAELRGDARTGRVPVILLGRREDENLEELARVVGANDYLVRPAWVKDVVALVGLTTAKEQRGVATLSAEEIAPAQLLRALLAGPRQGRLLLADGRGAVDYRSGSVIAATLDGQSGLDPLVRALALTRGEYAHAALTVTGEPTFHCDLPELVQQVLPRVNRWQALAQRSVPLEAVLQIDFKALAGWLPTLPDAVNGVVRLFDGRRTVLQVLKDSALDETTTLEVATRLFTMGVISTQPEGSPEALLPMPRLFEPRPTEAVETMVNLFGPAVALPRVTASALEPAVRDWFEAPKGLEPLAEPSQWQVAPLGALGVDQAAGPQMAASDDDGIPVYLELQGFSDGLKEQLAEPGIAEALREASANWPAHLEPTPRVDGRPTAQENAALADWEDDVTPISGRAVGRVVAQARRQEARAAALRAADVTLPAGLEQATISPSRAEALAPAGATLPPERFAFEATHEAAAQRSSEAAGPSTAEATARVAAQPSSETTLPPFAAASLRTEGTLARFAGASLRSESTLPQQPAAPSPSESLLPPRAAAPSLRPESTLPRYAAAPALGSHSTLPPLTASSALLSAQSTLAPQPLAALRSAEITLPPRHTPAEVSARSAAARALEDAAEQPPSAELEQAFFLDAALEERAAEAKPTLARAVLGIETEAAESPGEEEALKPEGKDSPLLMVAWVMAALVALTALGAWLFAVEERPTQVEATVVSTEALEPKEPAPLPPEPAVEVAPAPAEPSAPSIGLVEASRLYESGQLKAALAALEKLIADEPSNAQGWVMLGLARYDSGDNQGASEAADTALALDPKAARAHLVKATLLLEANQRAEADAQLDRYLALEPNGPFADEAHALLKRAQ